MCREIQSVCQKIFVNAQRSPDKLCLADANVSLTYGQYRDNILRCASALKANGIEKGAKVVVEAAQSAEYLTVGMALQLIGAIFVPVEKNCAPAKIACFADLCGASLAVTGKQRDDMPCPCISLRELTEQADRFEPCPADEFPCAGDVCEILFSTGTTGKEKGIVITNANNIALAQNVIDGVEMQDDNVELIPSPLNHSHGLRRYYANMYNGSTVIVAAGGMNIKGIFDSMDKYQVNSIDMVPSELTIVLKLSGKKLAGYKDRIRYIQFGAAPLMQADKDEVMQLLPDTRLYNFYGSTESGCIAIYNFNDGKDKKGCIGKPVVNADIIITGSDRNAIVSSAENTGLLASSGAMNMKEYFLDPDETAAVMYNGYIYTNDIAYYDEDGDIILLGRKGDVINVGGNKVSPDEVESIAKRHPMVEDCGCVPADSGIGQVPKLFVKVAKGYTLDEAELLKFIRANTEPYKVPKFIEETEEIPRTFNGKIIRRKLLEK